MNDPALNSLLQWGIQNSNPATIAEAKAQQRNIDTDEREHFLGVVLGTAGTQADTMLERMITIRNRNSSLEDRVKAFDELGESIAECNNPDFMENKIDHNRWNNLLDKSLQKKTDVKPLGEVTPSLWTLLLEELENVEAEARAKAAMCVKAAVENNSRGQEKLFTLGGIPKLVELATQDTSEEVRKKAIGALSSATRNFQPNLDAMVQNVPAKFKPDSEMDASDMDAITGFINQLKADI
ncbi:hypothetical protein CC78DRAFT_295299 [Lojkania enalia]|uniref:Nucleotide exchange factor Fes1 domain-containing protein n=1 Tax=Lojkania enalia TaxID=147567 RepID=A0A9P4K6B4_9PLEO|nr:hypothetical protein CC78DRAFT_295299 [Didymosphaeria enalia]